MTPADATARSAELDDDDDDTGAGPEENFDDIEADGTDELEEETGLDLSDASGLDADNVPNDEEFDRVGNAPD